MPSRRAGRSNALAGRFLSCLLEGAVETLAIWGERLRQRRQLAALDDRMVRDIGLSRADVEMESGKPFWRP